MISNEYVKKEVINIIKEHTIDKPIKAYQIIKEIKYRLNTNITSLFIRQVVEEARDNYTPIGSGIDGYFLAKDYKELTGTIKHFRSRSIDMLKRAKKLESCFKTEDQLSFWDNITDSIERTI